MFRISIHSLNFKLFLIATFFLPITWNVFQSAFHHATTMWAIVHLIHHNNMYLFVIYPSYSLTNFIGWCMAYITCYNIHLNTGCKFPIRSNKSISSQFVMSQLLFLILMAIFAHFQPKFHDGMKEWSCCKKRSHDFSLFLQIPGYRTFSFLMTTYFFRTLGLTFASIDEL